MQVQADDHKAKAAKLKAEKTRQENALAKNAKAGQSTHKISSFFTAVKTKSK